MATMTMTPEARGIVEETETNGRTDEGPKRDKISSTGGGNS